VGGPEVAQTKKESVSQWAIVPGPLGKKSRRGEGPRAPGGRAARRGFD
jgi:hypothetical protein